MENASKALIMAGGILLGILILSLMVTLLLNSKDVFTSYDQRKQEEALQQFNVNFTKYLGQKLTIHDVVTIHNFAGQKVTVTANGININKKMEELIPEELKKKEEYNKRDMDYYYTITITNYNDEGKVSKIVINTYIATKK